MSNTSNIQTPKLDRSGVNRIIVVLGMLVVFGVILFSLAGRTLQAELPGYIEYTRQVRYRLIPGVW